ncbi:MAG: hypothetical protein LBP51_07195 [Deferribacteraceae bacterium]|jgi:hypothetical protein|nr:hypothetical protein [Deferribacteraceae bacterium]
MRSIAAFIEEDVGFAVILLGGRFPLWGLFYLYFTQVIPLYSLVCFGIIVIFLRGLLTAREENRSAALGALISFYRYIFRPLGYLLLVEIVYLAATYMLLFGNRVDWGIFMAAFACYIVYYSTMLFTEKKADYSDFLLPRDAKFQIVIFLLWLYVFLYLDGLFFLISALTFIYILEFLSTLKVNVNKGILLSRVEL